MVTSKEVKEQLPTKYILHVSPRVTLGYAIRQISPKWKWVTQED